MSPDEFVKANVNRRANNLSEIPESDRARGCLYTAGGQGCKDTQGWQSEGIERFNTLRAFISQKRECEDGRRFYHEILRWQKELKDGRSFKKRKLSDKVVVEEHCDWSDDESEIVDRAEI
jgi:hypothetical protein